MARRQVFDIPDPKVAVTEHQIVTVACSCGHYTTAATPVEAERTGGLRATPGRHRVYLLHG